MMPISSGRRPPYGVSVDAIPFPGEDPLFAGVDNLSITDFTHVSTRDAVVNPAATVHARWPDGRPMVASLGSVVAVNVWGVSTAAQDGARPGYPADSDMTLVIANSLVYAAGQDPATACNGDYDDDGLPDDDEGVIGTDFQNPDSDADGFVDGIDTCPLLATNDNTDLDGDGQGDACDTDWDGDGVDNDVDNCPRVLNATQNDADSDGLGDACGDDWDADSVLNDVDNCPRHSNPEQEDHDDDGVGDACTPDDGRICGVVAGGSPLGLGLLVGVLLLVRRRRRWPTT
jgi:MYXO-CTERM domain-containing protein